MIETGLERLDEILGGGFFRGSCVAFLGSMERDNVILMHQMVLNLLKKGYKVLVVEMRQQPDVLQIELKHHGIDYSDYISSKQLLILDGFSNLYGPTQKHGPNVIPNPLDLGITSAIIRDTVKSGGYELVVIDDVTAPYAVQTDPKLYIRIMIRLMNSLKNSGVTVFQAILKDVFERGELAACLTPSDYILEVSGGFIEIKRTLQPLSLPLTRIPYVKSSEGIKSAWESYETLEEIKRNLTIDENSNLWFQGERVQIINEASEAALIEFTYKYLGPEEGKRFLYLWGRTETRGIGKMARRAHKTLKEALEYTIHATKTSGGGTLELVEVRDDFVVMRGYNLFPRGRGSRYPFHINYAGEIAQFISEFTGEEWEGDEIQCQAMGAEYCEFVFKKRKDQ